MRALDLFSGYGGLTLALEDYARPIMYCEIEKYAQAILLSRMDDGSIPFAPVWNDVTTLDGAKLRGLVDIVWGGFPCQGISEAGKGEGLADKRSGLFYEVVRICKEASPQFIFLENVPAIRTNGAIEVQEALAIIGYDCRWSVVSAAEVGAIHKRERWFCLASKALANTKSNGIHSTENCNEREGAHSQSVWPELRTDIRGSSFSLTRDIFNCHQWEAEPDVGRVVDGCPSRSHRIKALGNGVVPLQVKTAFKTLMGIK